MRIIDNFLPEEDFKRLQDFVLSREMPWFYSDYVSLDLGHGITDPNAQETFGFNHDCYDRSHQLRTPVLEHMAPMIKRITELDGSDIQIQRIRLSLKTLKAGFTKDNYNLPHVDLLTPHKSLIFYVNDSDGDTFIFNEYNHNGEFYDTFTVKDRVSPKANRALIIDGSQYHTASNPIETTRRVILNVNYV